MIPIAQFLHGATTIAPIAFLAMASAGLLAAAALHDIGFRTLPDTVALALLGCGVVAHLTTGDLPAALLAAVAIFLVTLLPWRWGAFGGGDVKLLAATALAVPFGALPQLLLTTAIAGGLLAMAVLVVRPFVPATHGPRPHFLLARVMRVEGWRIRRAASVPYGVAIAAGGAAALLSG